MNAGQKDRSVLKGAVAGLVGGLVASWVMNQFQAGVGKLQQSEGESQGSSEEPANVKAAVRVADAFGTQLQDDQKSIGGEVAHYAMGAFSGAVYGAAAELSPVVSTGSGALFGAVLSLLADDVAVPALKLSKPPNQYPFSTHATALASHIVYGTSTDAIRRIVRNYF